MSQYQVVANGTDFGAYEAESAQIARDLCAQDAGYKSEADMAERLGQSSELMATLIEESTYENLKTAVLAVEENNRFNQSSWGDWADAGHISETYGVDLSAQDEKIIEQAIATRGKSLGPDLRARELKEFGQNFTSLGFAHPGSAASADPDWISLIEVRYAAQ